MQKYCRYPEAPQSIKTPEKAVTASVNKTLLIVIKSSVNRFIQHGKKYHLNQQNVFSIKYLNKIGF